MLSAAKLKHPNSSLQPGRRRRIGTIAFSVAALFAWCCATAHSASGSTSAVEEVTQFERHMEEFFNSPEYAHNPAASFIFYDKDIRFFDIMLPTEYRGKQFRDHVIQIGKQFEGGKVEFVELEVHAAGTMGFATSLQHFKGKTPDGNAYDMTMRVTDCLEKRAGHWVIAHEHVSLALDTDTFMSVIRPKT